MNMQADPLATYLEALPPERRGEIEIVWQVVRENIPRGYVEKIGDKFLTFAADGEGFVMLASQKNYISLYLMPLYVFPELKAKLADAGMKLQRDKSCLRFNRADDLPLATLGEILAACPDASTYKSLVRQVCADGRQQGL